MFSMQTGHCTVYRFKASLQAGKSSSSTTKMIKQERTVELPVMDDIKKKKADMISLATLV